MESVRRQYDATVSRADWPLCVRRIDFADLVLLEGMILWTVLVDQVLSALKKRGILTRSGI